MVAQAIRNDPDWNGGEYKTQPKRWTYTMPVFLIMTDTPVRLQKQAPTRKEAEAPYDKVAADAQTKFDANDYLYWHESSRDYDPAPDLAKTQAPLLAVNSADVELNPTDLGVRD